MRRMYPESFWQRFKPLLLTVWVSFFAFTVSGQTPPPNDNFSNAIALTGTDITFSGTLAGATIEDTNEILAYEFYFDPVSLGSVWWTWTAPTNTELTLQILNPSTAEITEFPYTETAYNLIAVYSATNGSTSPSGLVLPAIGMAPDFPFLFPPTLSVPVTGGSNYYIQLIGNTPSNYTIRLVATNTPIIIQQPRSQTVYSNASATFFVFYAGAGQTNDNFQWYLNGTNLPGQTAAMLPLTNIDSSMAGAYTVAVSNSAGSTVSEPGILTVSQSNFPVILSAIGSTASAFNFAVAGEPGRSYRVKSSTDFTNWISGLDFPISPYSTFWDTSIFFCTNTSQTLTVPTTAPSEFFRVTPYIIGTPHAEICINNLRQIRIAKLLWGRDQIAVTNFYTPFVTALAQSSQLAHYLPHGALPFCPDDPNQTFGTSYSINNIQAPPVCQINSSNHILEEPQ